MRRLLTVVVVLLLVSLTRISHADPPPKNMLLVTQGAPAGAVANIKSLYEGSGWSVSTSNGVPSDLDPYCCREAPFAAFGKWDGICVADAEEFWGPWVSVDFCGVL